MKEQKDPTAVELRARVRAAEQEEKAAQDRYEAFGAPDTSAEGVLEYEQARLDAQRTWVTAETARHELEAFLHPKRSRKGYQGESKLDRLRSKTAWFSRATAKPRSRSRARTRSRRLTQNAQRAEGSGRQATGRDDDAQYLQWVTALEQGMQTGNPPGSMLLDAQIAEFAREFPEFSALDIAPARNDADALHVPTAAEAYQAAANEVIPEPEAMPERQGSSRERPDQAQAGTEAKSARTATERAWAEYQAAQAAADAARQISTDLGTDAGFDAWLLGREADEAYEEYEDAWVRENYSQVELDAIEAQNRAEGGWDPGWEAGQ